MNGTWTMDASGIQWAFDWIGKHRVRGEDAADLWEDPHCVDREAVPRGQLSGNVDVVGGVGIGRVRECGRRGHPRHESHQVQGERGPHGGAA